MVMLNESTKKELTAAIVLAIILLGAGFGLNKFYSKDAENSPDNQSQSSEQQEPVTGNPIFGEEVTDKFNELVNTDELKKVTVAPKGSSKDEMLVSLRTASEAEDYTKFAEILREVYNKEWGADPDFTKVESAIYMQAVNKYYYPGNYSKSLEVSTTVYNQVPAGWRFRYLRIISLERLGRAALEAGDLVTAEARAMDILLMMYRPECANLLADIYIQKIEANLAAGDKASAQNNLIFIWDFEVSPDRRTKLEELYKRVQ